MNRMLTILFIGILLAACTTSPPVVAERQTDPRLVLNKTWQWEATVTPVERIEVPAPERYTVLLEDGGNVQARFDCNNGGGEYRIAAGTLTFGPLFATRMACPEGSLDAPFMRDLQRVESFFVENGQLYLELPYDSGTMRFREVHNDRMAISGTIVFRNLEGGFFVIEGDDGRIYDPVNLEDAFKRDGLKVKVVAKLKPDMGSIHMVGDIIEIVTISVE